MDHSNPSIEFSVQYDDKGRPLLQAKLHSAGLGSDDIRLRFARLAMLYAQRVADKGPFAHTEVSNGDASTAVLEFTQELEGDSGFDDDYYDTTPVPGTVGVVLAVPEAASQTLGWAASPAYLAAQTVAKMANEAIEVAAGMSVERRDDEPGLGL